MSGSSRSHLHEAFQGLQESRGHEAPCPEARKPRHHCSIAAPTMLSWFVGGAHFEPGTSWFLDKSSKELPLFVRTGGFEPLQPGDSPDCRASMHSRMPRRTTRRRGRRKLLFARGERRSLPHLPFHRTGCRTQLMIRGGNLPQMGY